MQRYKIILKILFGIVFVAVIVYIILAIIARPAQDTPFFEGLSGEPLVMAHRGGKGLWPENTLFGFRRAIDMGVDILEMDVRATNDGRLVVIHDATVNRTTNGKGDVVSFSLDNLQQLDAGYYWTEDDGQSYPYRGQEIIIPLLEDVLISFPDQFLNIEIKPPEINLAESLCRLIRQYKMDDQVLIVSFDAPVLSAFRQACPQVATSLSEDEVRTMYMMNLFWLGRLYSPMGGAVQVPEYFGSRKVLTRRFVAAAHQRNLQVHAWTINDTYSMQRMLAMGVDGIITDYPNLMLALLGR
ncbi:glycerophosphodiester phosphodiesterase [Chloroflexota bacterium]